MGIIKRIVSGLANPGTPESGDPQTATAAEPDEPPETEQERRRRVQEKLFNSDPALGFRSTWRGGPPER